MIFGGGAHAHEVLGRDFSAIAAGTAEHQAERLATTLDVLREQPVRIVRVGSVPRGTLSLKGLLIQAGNVEVYGNDEADRSQNEALLCETLSQRHEDEKHVLLVVEQAETLQPEVVLSLRALTAARSQQIPTLHVLFVGRSASRELGICVVDASNTRRTFAKFMQS